MNDFKVNKQGLADYFFYIVASFVFLKPAGIDVNGYHQLNAMINGIAIILIIFLFIKQIKVYKKGINDFLLAEIIFFLIWIWCFWVNGNSVIGVIKIMLNALGFEFLTEYTIRKDKLRVMINCFCAMYIILLAANLYLMIKNYGWVYGWNNGLYDSFSYLESDNGTNGYIMGALLFSLLYTRLKQKNITLIFIMVMALDILNEYRIWSASSIIGIFMFAVYFFFIQKRKGLKNLGFWGAIVLNIGVTFFRIQKLFSYFFEKFLNRDANMTGRTEWWDRGIDAFKSSPIWGVGEFNYPLDNILIQPLTQGGILLITAFIVMIYVACKKLPDIDLDKHLLYKDAFFTFCIVIVLSIGEAWMNFKGFWIILSIFVNLRNVDSRNVLV